jgi:phosphoglycolate phosphatase
MIPDARAVIFDLDGTLIDTIHDIADSVNEVLESHNLPQHSVESYKYRVGDGIKILLERSLPQTLSKDMHYLDQIINEFNLSYDQHWNNHTRPYSGITPLLHSLQSHGIKIAILSNKPQHFTDLCAKYFFPDITFQFVVGATSSFPKKPDPSSALFMIKELKVLQSEVFYVGDTSIDMTTANNAGVYPIGVSWGFRSQEELINTGAKIILNYPEELMLMISKKE